jgi:hypothetical protein
MLGKMVAVAAALLLSTQVQAQMNQGANPGPAQGVTSGPGAGTPATMSSPQAGSLATKHQREVLRKTGQAVRGNHGAGGANNAAGATGSSTPPYAAPPR